ncbi:hypothetical protein ACHAXT_002916 [Thalassiosira profunda]
MRAATTAAGGEDNCLDNGRRRRGILGHRRGGAAKCEQAPASSDFGRLEPELNRFLFANGDDDCRSMGTMKSALYSLVVEAPEVRNERLIMAFEAFSIFGALFLNGVWILYEYGSAKNDYGGEATTELFNRVFEGVMAASLACTTFLTLFAAGWWVQTVCTLGSTSSPDFIFQLIKVLAACKYLLWGTITSTVVALFLAIYSNLSPQWPGVIITLAVFFVVFARLMYMNGRAQCKGTPLEFYHYPMWYRLTLLHPLGAHKYAFGKGKKDLLRRAKQEANEIKSKAKYQRRASLPPKDDGLVVIDQTLSEVLRDAASNLGAPKYDTAAIEESLGKDWVLQTKQLKGMSVERLSQYMPYGLADEVHELVQTDI